MITLFKMIRLNLALRCLSSPRKYIFALGKFIISTEDAILLKDIFIDVRYGLEKKRKLMSLKSSNETNSSES